MDKRIIYVSYATINTPYVKVIEKYLLPTLQKFNLTYDVTYPEHMGSWQKNTQYKATFLKEMLLNLLSFFQSLFLNSLEHINLLFTAFQNFD